MMLISESETQDPNKRGGSVRSVLEKMLRFASRQQLLRMRPLHARFGITYSFLNI